MSLLQNPAESSKPKTHIKQRQASTQLSPPLILIYFFAVAYGGFLGTFIIACFTCDNLSASVPFCWHKELKWCYLTTHTVSPHKNGLALQIQFQLCSLFQKYAAHCTCCLRRLNPGGFLEATQLTAYNRPNVLIHDNFYVAELDSFLSTFISCSGPYFSMKTARAHLSCMKCASELHSALMPSAEQNHRKTLSPTPPAHDHQGKKALLHRSS